MSQIPHDALRAFTPGSQPYLSLSWATTWTDFSVPFGDPSDTRATSYLDPASPWTCPSSQPFAITVRAQTCHSIEPEVTDERTTVSDLNLVTF